MAAFSFINCCFLSKPKLSHPSTEPLAGDRAGHDPRRISEGAHLQGSYAPGSSFVARQFAQPPAAAPPSECDGPKAKGAAGPPPPYAETVGPATGTETVAGPAVTGATGVFPVKAIPLNSATARQGPEVAVSSGHGACGTPSAGGTAAAPGATIAARPVVAASSSQVSPPVVSPLPGSGDGSRTSRRLRAPGNLELVIRHHDRAARPNSRRTYTQDDCTPDCTPDYLTQQVPSTSTRPSSMGASLMSTQRFGLENPVGGASCASMRQSSWRGEARIPGSGYKKGPSASQVLASDTEVKAAEGRNISVSAGLRVAGVPEDSVRPTRPGRDGRTEAEARLGMSPAAHAVTLTLPAVTPPRAMGAVDDNTAASGSAEQRAQAGPATAPTHSMTATRSGLGGGGGAAGGPRGAPGRVIGPSRGVNRLNSRTGNGQGNLEAVLGLPSFISEEWCVIEEAELLRADTVGRAGVVDVEGLTPPAPVVHGGLLRQRLQLLQPDHPQLGSQQRPRLQGQRDRDANDEEPQTSTQEPSLGQTRQQQQKQIENQPEAVLGRQAHDQEVLDGRDERQGSGEPGDERQGSGEPGDERQGSGEPGDERQGSGTLSMLTGATCDAHRGDGDSSTSLSRPGPPRRSSDLGFGPQRRVAPHLRLSSRLGLGLGLHTSRAATAHLLARSSLEEQREFAPVGSAIQQPQLLLQEAMTEWKQLGHLPLEAPIPLRVRAPSDLSIQLDARMALGAPVSLVHPPVPLPLPVTLSVLRTIGAVDCVGAEGPQGPAGAGVAWPWPSASLHTALQGADVEAAPAVEAKGSLLAMFEGIDDLRPVGRFGAAPGASTMTGTNRQRILIVAKLLRVQPNCRWWLLYGNTAEANRQLLAAAQLTWQHPNLLRCLAVRVLDQEVHRSDMYGISDLYDNAGFLRPPSSSLSPPPPRPLTQEASGLHAPRSGSSSASSAAATAAAAAAKRERERSALRLGDHRSAGRSRLQLFLARVLQATANADMVEDAALTLDPLPSQPPPLTSSTHPVPELDLAVPPSSPTPPLGPLDPPSQPPRPIPMSQPPLVPSARPLPEPGSPLRGALRELGLAPGDRAGLVVSEWADLGNLYDLLYDDINSPFVVRSSWPPGNVWRAFLETAWEVAGAMDCLHAGGVAHGSLHPRNVLLVSCPTDLRSFIVKVGDIGPLGSGGVVAASVQPLQLFHPYNDDSYNTYTPTMPDPEELQQMLMWRREVGETPYTADVYAYGMLLYEMAASGVSLAMAGAGGSDPVSPASSDPAPSWPPGIHEVIEPLYAACVSAHPGNRPTFRQIVALLRDVRDSLAAGM